MSAAPRPPIVTLACVFVGFTAFLLLIQLTQALGNWGTIEMQDALEPALATLDERGIDITMGALLSTLRWVGLGGVLLLVAALVFAIYAARGDQASRIGVSVLGAVIGLLIVPLGWLGLLQAFFLFFASASLWSPDARRWYASRQGRSTPTDIDTPAPEPQEPQAPSRRPGAVLAAGLVTVLGSSLVGTLAALYLVVYGFAREEYVRLVQDGPFAGLYSPGELETAMELGFWGCVAALPLTLAGLAAGISLLARLRLGRVATLAVSWITAAAGVVLVPFGLLATGAAIAVIVLLRRDEARAWTK